MASLLLVSSDFATVERIEQLAGDAGVRTRSVAKGSAASEWLGMQKFDLLLIDSRVVENPGELMGEGWRQNPLLVCGVFNPDGKVEDEWGVRLIGALVFSGGEMFKEIRRCLQGLPGSLAFAESAYFSVLVVDDLDAPRDIICAYIEALGYPSVRAAGSAQECLAALRKDPEDYFCVISDISMPEVTGIELLHQIRDDRLLFWLPVVFLTAFSTTDNLIECIKAGATGFLTKPTKKPLLLAELQKAKRLVLHKQSPRLCSAEEAHFLEDALYKRYAG